MESRRAEEVKRLHKLSLWIGELSILKWDYFLEDMDSKIQISFLGTRVMVCMRKMSC